MSKNLRKGDIVELAFDLEATRRGFNISKPTISALRYDRVLEYNGRLFRVQIKCATKRGNYVSASIKHGRNSFYKKEDIDALAIYIPHLNQWHLVISSNMPRTLSFGSKLAINNNWEIFKNESNQI